MCNKKFMKSIGLSLGEGGARGLAHIAYISVFEDLNIKPSIIWIKSFLV